MPDKFLRLLALAAGASTLAFALVGCSDEPTTKWISYPEAANRQCAGHDGVRSLDSRRGDAVCMDGTALELQTKVSVGDTDER